MELIKHTHYLEVQNFLGNERLDKICGFVEGKEKDAQNILFLDEEGIEFPEFKSAEIADSMVKINPAYRNYRRANEAKTILNYLGGGQSYPPHHDICAYVGTLWLCLNEFSGGEFVFNDLEKTIKPSHNSCVIFPAGLQHEVLPVKGQGRFSISHLMGIRPHQWASDLKHRRGNYADIYC